MSRARSLAVFLMLAAAAPTGAAASELQLRPGSRVWIDGKTNVHAWRCAGTVDGELAATASPEQIRELLARWRGRPAGADLEGDPAAGAGWRATVDLAIPIDELDCANRAMERDMRRSLRADEHPTIRYRFTRVHAARFAPAGAVPAFALVVEGEISLAGVARRVQVPLTATLMGADRVMVRGAVPLRMTDFGIAPPEALLGMIRARDEIWVSVDLEVVLPG